jgi:hypothetical protein
MNAVAWSVTNWRNDRGADPRMSDTVEVMNTGLPIVAPRAASSMSTAVRPSSLRLAPELVRRQFLKPDPAPRDVTDDAHLRCLTQ